jgi:uncharacterized protein (UPF0332 family)
MEAAKRLFRDGFCEDAASQAYYAMYHAAKACLALEGSSPRTHEGVITEFGRFFILTGKVDQPWEEHFQRQRKIGKTATMRFTWKLEEKKLKRVLNGTETFLVKAEEIVKTAKQSIF